MCEIYIPFGVDLSEFLADIIRVTLTVGGVSVTVVGLPENGDITIDTELLGEITVRVELEQDDPETYRHLSKTQIEVWKVLREHVDNSPEFQKGLENAAGQPPGLLLQEKIRISMDPNGKNNEYTCPETVDEHALACIVPPTVEEGQTHQILIDQGRISQHAETIANAQSAACIGGNVAEPTDACMADRARMIVKLDAETMIHEMCHFVHPNETNDGDTLNDYFMDSDLRKCERKTYKEFFGDEPESLKWLCTTNAHPACEAESIPAPSFSFPSTPASNQSLKQVYESQKNELEGIHHETYVATHLRTLPSNYRVLWN